MFLQSLVKLNSSIALRNFASNSGENQKKKVFTRVLQVPRGVLKQLTFFLW